MYAIRYDSNSTVNGERVGIVYAVDISHLTGIASFSYCKDLAAATAYDTEDEAWRVIRSTAGVWPKAEPVKVV